MDFKVPASRITTIGGLTYAKPKWNRKGKTEYVLGAYITKPKRENGKYYRDSPTNNKTMKREKAAIIMLRNMGYTYNQLASALFRSTSYIYKVIQTAKKRGSLNNAALTDHRGGAIGARIRAADARMGYIIASIGSWLGFMTGVEDKPP